jgi:hypothetical protein
MTDLAFIFTFCKKLGLVVYSCINVTLHRLLNETLKVPFNKAYLLCQ